MKMKKLAALALAAVMLLSMMPVSLAVSPIHTHSWKLDRMVRQATCTESGLGIYRCDGCGMVERRTLPALGHKWRDWVVVREATADLYGLETRVCKLCGAEERRRLNYDPAAAEQPESALQVKAATLSYVPEGVYDNFENRIGSGTVTVDYTYNGVDSGYNSYNENLTITMVLFRDGEDIGFYTLPFEGYIFREDIEFPGPGEYCADVTVTDGTEMQTVTSNTVVIEGEATEEGLPKAYAPTEPVDATRTVSHLLFHFRPYAPTEPVDDPGAPNAEITLSLEGGDGFLENVHVGDWVPVIITVKNTGEVPVTFLEFSGFDSKTDLEFPPFLDAGQSDTLWAWHEVTAEDLEAGYYTDPEDGFMTDERQEESTLWLSATVNYVYFAPEGGNPRVWRVGGSASLIVHLTDVRSMLDDIALDCQYDDRAYTVGEEITLNWSVTNVGPETLHKLPNDEGNEAVPGLPEVLAPGESYAWTETVAVTQELYEEGLSNGEDGNPDEDGSFEGRSFNVVDANIITYYDPSRPEGDSVAADDYFAVAELLPAEAAAEPLQAPWGDTTDISLKNGVPSFSYDLSKAGLELFVQVTPEDAKPFYQEGETVHVKVFVKNSGSAILYRLGVYGGNTGGTPSLTESIQPGSMIEWKSVLPIQVKDNYGGVCRIKYVAHALMTPDYTFSSIQNIPGDAPWVNSEEIVLYFPIVQTKAEPAQAVEADSLLLTVTQTSEKKDVYFPGDTLEFSAVVENQSGVDVEDVRLVFTRNGELAEMAKALGDFKKDQKSSPCAYQYTVTEEDAEKGEFVLAWDASGQLPEGVLAKPSPEEHAPEGVTYDYVTAKRVQMSIQAEEKPQPLMTLTGAAEKPETLVTGQIVPIVLTFHNDGPIPVYASNYYVIHEGEGDSGADFNNARGTIMPGGEVSFTYNAAVRPVEEASHHFERSFRVYYKVPGDASYKTMTTNQISVGFIVGEEIVLPSDFAPPADLPSTSVKPEDTGIPAVSDDFYDLDGKEAEARIAVFGDVMDDWKKEKYQDGENTSLSLSALNCGEVTFERVLLYLNGALCNADGPVEKDHRCGGGMDQAGSFGYQIHDSGDGYDYITVSAVGEYVGKDGQKQTVTDKMTLVLPVAPPTSVPTVSGKAQLFLAAAKLTAEPLHFDGMGNTPKVEYMLTVSNLGEAPCVLSHIRVFVPDGYEQIDLGGQALSPGNSVNVPADHVFKETQLDPLDGMLHISFVAVADVDTDVLESNEAALAHETSQEPVKWTVPDETSLTLKKEAISAPALPGGYQLGEKIAYRLTVTNTGSAAIPSVTIRDDLIGPGDLDEIKDLQPKESRSVESGYYYIVQQSDVDAGQVYNIASAIWTDTASGKQRTQKSNPVTVFTLKEAPGEIKEGEPKAEVKIAFVPGAEHTGIYREGEQLDVAVYWQNLSDETLTHVNVSDLLAVSSGAAAGKLLEDGTLAPHESGSFTYPYTVTHEDAFNGFFDDTANLDAVDENGQPVTASDHQEAKAMLFSVPGLTVVKEETSAYPNGQYYQENDVIQYKITYKNTGDVPLKNVKLFDCLKDSVTFSGFSTVTTLNPGEERTYKFSYTVTGQDVLAGQVKNYALVLFSTDTLTDCPVASAPVISLTGGDTGYTPVESQGQEDSCVLQLHSLYNGAEMYLLSFCEEHAKVLAQVESNSFKDSSDPRTAANGWNQVRRLWQAETDKLYQRLLDKAVGGDARLAVMQERAAFYAYVNAAEAMLAARRPDLAAKAAAEMLQRRTIALCYLTHHAPETPRPDSRVGNAYDTFFLQENSMGDVPIVVCIRDEGYGDGAGMIVNALCEDHREIATVTDDALAAATTPEEIALAFYRAQRLYRDALDAQATDSYKAADPALRPQIAAARMALDTLIEARQALLESCYPDDAQTVAEELARAWRDALIDRCLLDTAAPAETAEPTAEPTAESTAGQDAAAIAALAAITQIDMTGKTEAADSEALLGEWRLTSLSVGDLVLTPEMADMQITLSFLGDGTGTALTVQDGESMETSFTWREENGQIIMTSFGQEAPLTFADGALEMTLDGVVMRLTR